MKQLLCAIGLHDWELVSSQIPFGDDWMVHRNDRTQKHVNRVCLRCEKVQLKRDEAIRELERRAALAASIKRGK